MTPQIIITHWGARLAGRVFPCSVGRNGVSHAKREGDGTTPAGVLHITGLLYRPDRIARHRLPDWARPIARCDLWSDDPADPQYNHLVRAPHRYSHEHLRRADPLYDLILTTDWNAPQPVPGTGSAIFLHAWRRPRYPTAGCIAFRPTDLLWIANHSSVGQALRILG